jgi:hypothetical protein
MVHDKFPKSFGVTKKNMWSADPRIISAPELCVENPEYNGHGDDDQLSKLGWA